MSRITKTFDFYSDPGHGWVKVPMAIVVELGIAQKISTSYSYRKGDFAYLEEDQDASTFIQAFETKFGVKPKFREHNCNESSKIRNFSSFWYVDQNFEEKVQRAKQELLKGRHWHRTNVKQIQNAAPMQLSNFLYFCVYEIDKQVVTTVIDQYFQKINSSNVNSVLS